MSDERERPAGVAVAGEWVPPAEADEAPGAAPEPAPTVMRSRRRGAIVHLVGGSANLLLLTVQGFLLVPMYLHYVGNELYGAWLGSGDIMGWLSVLDMGIAAVMTQRMAAAHGRGDHDTVAGYFGTGLVLQLPLVVALVLAAMGVAPFIPGWMGIHGARADVLSACFALSAVGTGLGILNAGVISLPTSLQAMTFVNAAALASSAISIVFTYVLLVMGKGLWALALSLVVRNGVQLALNGVYTAVMYRREVNRRLRPRWAVWKEMSVLAGPVFLAAFGSAAAGRSDAALLAIFLRPEVATIYVLTRRTAEIVSMFLARVGGAVFPGFAHLVGQGDHERSGRVFNDVLRLYVVMAAICAACYMALNGTFVSLWVGAGQYGGHLLTVLLGVAMIVTGRSALVTFLYGAAGRIERGSYLVVAETMARTALAALFLWLIGPVGLPLAGIVTALVSAEVGIRWVRRDLHAAPSGRRGLAALPWVPVLLLAAGAAAGGVRWSHTWVGFVAWGALFSAVATGVLLALDATSRNLLVRRLGGVFPRRAANS